MTVDITPTERNGQYYVAVRIDGEANSYGPYADADEAEAMVNRISAVCRCFHWQVAATPAPARSR